MLKRWKHHGSRRSYLKQMADSLIGLDNPHLNISGAFTPQAFAELSTSVNNWGIVPAAALIASDLWLDIVSNTEWSDIIDPVSQHELLLTGKLGQIHGVELITDQFRHAQHKVLNGGEIYIVGGADYHGQYTDRGGVTSQPLMVHKNVFQAVVGSWLKQCLFALQTAVRLHVVVVSNNQ